MESSSKEGEAEMRAVQEELQLVLKKESEAQVDRSPFVFSHARHNTRRVHVQQHRANPLEGMVG